VAGETTKVEECVEEGGIRTILGRNNEATSSTKKPQQRWIEGKRAERDRRGD
jgi:hypothetical protein